MAWRIFAASNAHWRNTHVISIDIFSRQNGVIVFRMEICVLNPIREVYLTTTQFVCIANKFKTGESICFATNGISLNNYTINFRSILLYITPITSHITHINYIIRISNKLKGMGKQPFACGYFAINNKSYNCPFHEFHSFVHRIGESKGKAPCLIRAGDYA